MRWAIIKCVKIIFISTFLGVIFSNYASAWKVETSPEFISSDIKVTSITSCSGRWGAISVSGQGTIQACIMGDTVKIASYFSIQGPISYAINFPFDSTFHPLDVCTGFWGCSYSEEKDLFVGFLWASPSESRAVLYKDFAKNLSKSIQGGTIHYGLGDTSPQYSIKHPNGTVFFAQTATTSNNGKWVLMEVRSFGFYRVNTETLEARRVIAPGLTYTNYGIQPGVQLAISNDGQIATVMGLRMGVWVIKIDDTCGDMLSGSTQEKYTGAVTPCPFLITPTNIYIDSFMHAVLPQFSYDSLSLSFNIYGYGVQARRITLLSEDVSENLTYHLAIGDSFTSGEGEVDDSLYLGGSKNRCHISSRSYPYLVGTVWGYSTHNAACSGATIATARGEGVKQAQPKQLLEVEARLPQRLTVGIGGNDAGLMGKLKTCIGLDTCEWARSAKERQTTALEIKSLYPKLRLFYEDLKSKMPGKVIAVGYPKIISSQPICLSGIGLLLNQTERTFMNEGIHYLNEVIQSAANDSEVEFVDVEDIFSGTELCTLSFSPAMNGIRTGDDYAVIESVGNFKVVGAESFHPTPAGHELIKNRIAERFPRVYTSSSCTTCSQFRGVPNPNGYWEGDATIKRQTLPFINKVIIKKGDAFEIALPALSFQADSDVRIELHSEVQILKTVKTLQDGGLKTTITGDFEPGHHSVHLMGVTNSGESVDVYDFITVEEGEELLLGSDPKESMVQKSSVKSLAIADASTSREKLVTSSAILGASVVTMPSQLNPIPDPEKRAVLYEKANPVPRNSFPLLIISAIVGAVIAAIGMYLFYRQKHP